MVGFHVMKTPWASLERNQDCDQRVLAFSPFLSNLGDVLPVTIQSRVPDQYREVTLAACLAQFIQLVEPLFDRLSPLPLDMGNVFLEIVPDNRICAITLLEVREVTH